MRFLKSLFNRPALPRVNTAPLYFFNTSSQKKDLFAPLKANLVTFYSCGPTVYSRAHIGNLRAYVFSDTVARVLMDAGYHVRRVINITDVGHLVGDGDDGEDKIAIAAKNEQKKPAEIAEHYATLFVEDLGLLGVDTTKILFPLATEYIPQQIAMAKVLEQKGYTYRIKDGLYYDTAKFPEYGALGGIPLDQIKDGTAASLLDRTELVAKGRIKANPEKHNPADFALWRASKPRDLQYWASPWGPGNPGWHIECSAMIKALLGDTIDIHSGGIDHIPVHHNNEIAQSEVANGKQLARYWLHGAFLTIEGEKIAKSLKNDIYLEDIQEHGLHPLALRYFFLQAHYRSPLTFSWEALTAANEALHRLWRLVGEVREEAKGVSARSEEERRIVAFVRDDLATPAALAHLWDTLRGEDLSAKQKWGVVEAVDPLLGLSLLAPPVQTKAFKLEELPNDIRALVEEREDARAERDFATADRIRIHLSDRGYRVEDGPSGPLLTPLPK